MTFLNDEFLLPYKSRPVNWGFPSGPNSLGEVTYRRTYARIAVVFDKGPMKGYRLYGKIPSHFQDSLDQKLARLENEVWWETVLRVVEGTFETLWKHCDHYHLPFDPVTARADAREMFERIFSFKFTPPGRGLWMMGTDFVRDRGGAALNNCGYVSTENIDKEFSKPFRFLMDMSMLGVGVGFDTKGAGKVTWCPDDSKGSYTHVIGDSREGWVDYIGALIDWGLGRGPEPVPDASKVRPYGSLINGFGGVSSGPDPLLLLGRRVKALVLARKGRKITSQDIVDVMNMEGACVVAGNVRRCLPEGTLVHTGEGLIPIEDVKPGMLAKTSRGYSPISELVEQGLQSVCAVRTQLGEFHCTERHLIAVLTAPGKYSWKKAGELIPGDRAIFVDWATDGVETTLPPWSYDKPKHSTTCKDISVPALDEDMAWFFGQLHGDGYVYPNFEEDGFNAYVSVACAGDQEEVIRRCRAQLMRFGVNLCDVTPTPPDRSHKVRAQSKQLAWYLSQFKRAHTPLEVPEFVLRGRKEIRAAYVAGLMDADGCPTNRPITLAVSIYPEYLKQVQAVYASLGIPTRFCHRRGAVNTPDQEWKNLYQIDLVGEKAISLFIRTVMPYSSRDAVVSGGKRSQNDYGFPSEWVGQSGVRYGKSWCQNNRQMTVATFERCGGDLKHLIPVEVLEVIPGVKEVRTYDISVPGASEFVCQEGLLVHNTAEIAFGEPEDESFLDLKDYEKNPGRAAWGWTSNNSVFARVGMDYHAAAERTRKNGEPGYFWLENAQKYGRMKDPPDNRDYRVRGTNPCGEQSLEPYELCCLVETYPSRHGDLKDFKRTLKYAYLYAKAVTLVPTHWRETNAVLLRNRRIGTSVSGVVDFLQSHSERKLATWLDEGYQTVCHYDRAYSEWLAVRESIKKTSVKPSGTVSLPAGVRPGAHYPTDDYHLRRIRFAKDHPDVPAYRGAGYRVEPDVRDPYTVVVEFPVAGNGCPTESEVSLARKVHLAALLQKYWADNQVSYTATFKPEEGGQIEDLLRAYEDKLKAISFLPILPRGAYAQMPYESLTKGQYEDMVKGLKRIVWPEGNAHDQEERSCDGGACEVKS